MDYTVKAYFNLWEFELKIDFRIRKNISRYLSLQFF